MPCHVVLCYVCQAVFEDMDLDHDGVITGQQLHEGLAKMGATISERDVAEFLKVSKVRAEHQLFALDSTKECSSAIWKDGSRPEPTS